MNLRGVMLGVLPALAAVFVIGLVRQQSVFPGIEADYQARRTAHEAQRTAGWTYHAWPKPPGSACCRRPAIVMAEGGRVWVAWGTRRKGISTFDGSTWKTFDGSHSPALNEYFGLLAVDGRGRVWIGQDQVWIPGTDRFLFFDGLAWKRFEQHGAGAGFARNRVITAFAADRRGRLWVGSYPGYPDPPAHGRVHVFDGTTWAVHPAGVAGPVRESSRQLITAIAFDRQDRAWIAVHNGGVHLFDGKSWKSHADQSLGLQWVSGLALGRNGHVWVGTQNGGLLSYGGTRWTEHVRGTGPNDVGTEQEITDIAVDDRGWVWYLAAGELRVYARGRVTRLTPATSGLAGKPEAIAADGRGRIWVVTGHSISIPGLDAPRAVVTELPPPPTAPHPLGYWLAVIASVGAWLAVHAVPETLGTRARPRETWIAISAILGTLAGLSAVLLLLHNLCPQVCDPLPQTGGVLFRFRVFATVLSLVAAYYGGKLGWLHAPRYPELIAILSGILGGTAAGAFTVELWRSSEVLVFFGF